MAVALGESRGTSHTPPAGKTICGLALSAKLDAPAVMLKSPVPAVSRTAGEMEAMTGGWLATTWNPLVPESEPNAPVASSTSMVYGPPGAMPLGQPPAPVSLAGVGWAPEHVGTTPGMVLAFTYATRRSRIDAGVELPLIGAAMVTVGAGPENGCVAGCVNAFLMVITWFLRAHPNRWLNVTVPSAFHTF